MYSGVPSVRLEGNKEAAVALIKQGKMLLSKVHTVAEASGARIFSMVEAVPGVGTITAFMRGDINIIHIAAYSEGPHDFIVPEVEADGILPPDFYSGFVTDNEIIPSGKPLAKGQEQDYGVVKEFIPTQDCIKNHDELHSGRQQAARLAVATDDIFSEYKSKSQTREFSEHLMLRSGMYSGRMVAAAQIVLGLGRMSLLKFKDPRTGGPGTSTEHLKRVERDGVRLRYDHRFFRTHGITMGADGVPWLVEISNYRGVMARPLPVFPTTDAAGYAEGARLRGDDSMAQAVEWLGGCPTGEAFPGDPKALEELKKRGEVLQLLSVEDMRPFYSVASHYSSAMGWAFNDSGSIAHNTGYTFDEASNLQYGLWYAVTIKIGPILPRTEPNAPLAAASAELKMMRRSPLWAPAHKIGRYIPFKVHEPLLPGLLSHDASALGPVAKVPDYTTPVYVCWVNDELKVVSHTRTTAVPTHKAEGDLSYVECAYGGEWSVTNTTGLATIPAMMITNDFDDRRPLFSEAKTERMVTTAEGPDPPKFSDFIESPESCFIWRDHAFMVQIWRDTVFGDTSGSCVMVPAGDRSAFYYMLMNGNVDGSQHFYSKSWAFLIDPYIAYGWRCFPRINAPPFPPNRGCKTDKCGGKCTFGGRGVHKERRVVCNFRIQYTCDWAADMGNWINDCDIVDQFNKPPRRRVPQQTNESKSPTRDGDVTLLASGYNGPLVTRKKGTISDGDIGRWFVPSPDPETQLVQFIFATHSGVGNDCLIYNTDITMNQADTKVEGYGANSLTNKDGVCCIIGVT